MLDKAEANAIENTRDHADEKRSMIVFIALLAFVIVLVYFLSQRRDETWERYRQRQRERSRRTGPAQPPDPNFRFDDIPGDNGPAEPGPKDGPQ